MLKHRGKLKSSFWLFGFSKYTTTDGQPNSNLGFQPLSRAIATNNQLYHYGCVRMIYADITDLCITRASTVQHTVVDGQCYRYRQDCWGEDQIRFQVFCLHGLHSKFMNISYFLLTVILRSIRTRLISFICESSSKQPDTNNYFRIVIDRQCTPCSSI